MGNGKKSLFAKDDRYPGLQYTAKYIGVFFPRCKTYIEPFAGMARTAKYARADKIILNDMSDVSNQRCKKLYPHALITQEDFEYCIEKWDHKDNFFLIDYPWRTDFYANKSITFCDRTAKEYEIILEEICPKLKADWIVCTLHTRKLKFAYTKVVKDVKPQIFGYPAQTRLYSNKPLIPKVPTMDSWMNEQNN